MTTVKCCIEHETDEAILITADGEKHWIPLSQVEKIVRRPIGFDEVQMTDWIAKQKGLD